MTSSYDRLYAKNRFVLTFDDQTQEPAWLKSVEVPLPKANVITEKAGLTLRTFKHTSTLEVGEISAELGVASHSPVTTWIKNSLNREFSRQTGSVTYLDHNLKARWRQEFRGALITEVAFPALDAGGKNSTFLTVKWKAESIMAIEEGKEALKANLQSGQKKNVIANFRLDLGRDLGLDQVVKVDQLSIKQTVKELRFGGKRHPELEPIGIEYGNLTFYIPLACAKKVLQWHDQSVRKGGRDPKLERQGALEFLGPDQNEVLLTLKLDHVGCFAATIDKGDAESGEDTKLVKVECYVEKIEIK